MITIWYDILKQRRQAAGLTTKELGALIGVNNAAISNAERGGALVSDDIVSRLQNYFLLGVCGRLGDCGSQASEDESTEDDDNDNDNDDNEDNDNNELSVNELDDEDGEDDV